MGRLPHSIRRAFLTGMLLLVPAWGTFLILRALVTTVEGWIAALLGPSVTAGVPGLGLALLVAIILLAGAVSTHFLGQRLVRRTEEALKRIPLVRSIYATLQGMTDILNFRQRFNRSTVVAFPFPRDGLWALGFVMGGAPPPVQRVSSTPLVMLFVPTAIHPFTGYLAFVPRQQVCPLHLPVEDAMKMEFSAGLYRPRPGWLRRVEGPGTGVPWLGESRRDGRT